MHHLVALVAVPYVIIQWVPALVGAHLTLMIQVVQLVIGPASIAKHQVLIV